MLSNRRAGSTTFISTVFTAPSSMTTCTLPWPSTRAIWSTCMAVFVMEAPYSLAARAGFTWLNISSALSKSATGTP